MNDSKSNCRILKFQKLYLKHYGARLSLNETGQRLNALASLIEIASESKATREKDHSVISPQK